jgi:phosphate-selective porin OprO and OprP
VTALGWSGDERRDLSVQNVSHRRHLDVTVGASLAKEMRKYLSILSALALAGPALAQAPAPTEPPPPVPAPVDTAPPPTTGDPPPAEPKPEEQKPANVGYDKGFFIKSDDGKYSLKITGRVQPFYNLLRTETPANKNVANFFEIRRARLVLEGNIHTKKLLYKMQSDFGKGYVTLKDFHADVELTKDVWLRAGQWKRPFSRQQINSSGRLEIADRSITDRAFGAGRDIGVAIRNDYEKSPDLEWIVGVFNGTGDAAALTSTTMIDPMTGAATTTTGLPTNVPKEFKPAVIGRVGINRGGLKGYSEADLEGGPLRFGAAASVWLEGDYDENDQSNQKVEVDGVVKVEGLSLSGGVYYMTEQDGESVSDFTASLLGFHAQAGYFLVPKHWQAVGRFGLITDQNRPDGVDKTLRDQQEISVGGNYYGFGHDAKLVAAVRFTKIGEAGYGDNILFELGANIGF